MLSEANRVLKKGGRAGFTVWGRREKCPLYFVIPKLLKQIQQDPENEILISSYYAHYPDKSFEFGEDLEGIKKLFAPYFSNLRLWYQT